MVDTSAIVAVLAEPDGAAYVEPLWAAASVALSAVNAYECRLVLSGLHHGRPRFDPGLLGKLDALVASVPIEIVPFDAEQAILAHEAYLRWGKGFHRAALNLADCAAYALSRRRREPLLFKGDDFALTDVEPALGGSR